MPSVFISHVSDDKDRLAPFIRHLLDKLDPDVGVWIDAANKVAGLAPHPRLSSIEPGEDWLQRIHTELAAEGCIVLGFWSARATARPREVFLREVDIARKCGRFVPVSLDPMDMARIPAPFSGDHIHDVSKFGSPSDQGDFDLVVRKLQHLLRKRSVQVAIDEDRLPYLADRQPQIARICNAVETSLLDGRARASGPLCFIVPCHADDVADMFLWRLTQKDGPERCGQAQSHDQAGWVDLLLNWPRTTKPEQFLKEFGEENRSRIRQKVLEGLKRNRPICFSNKVLSTELRPKLSEFLEEWSDFWASEYPSIEQQAAAGQGLSPPSTIAVLAVVVQEQRRMFSFRNPLAACCSEIEGFKPGHSKRGRPVRGSTVVLPLERLAPVSAQDAEVWIGHSEITRRGLDRHLRGYLKSIFGPKARDGIRMQSFADKLLESDFGRGASAKK